MAGKFAASVVLGDLNDFIVPAQSCVNPLFADDVNKGATAEESAKVKRGMARITLDSDVFAGAALTRPAEMRPDLIKTTERKTAKVTLNDCLACSGCVTSAEAVLITQQSSLEFRTHVTSGRYARIVVSLSPQAIASIAARFDVTCGVAYRRLAAYFRTLGVHHVVDTLSASNVSLLETAAEFVARRRRRGSGGAGAGAGAAADAGAAVPATSDDAAAKRLRTALPGSVEPLLSSACPGWICFAEKTQPDSLPYISTVKSPQQIMGTVVKRLLKLPGPVYHTSVMPCFDKKLEASRKEFEDVATGTRDVDCVLTSMEVEEMMAEDGFAFVPMVDDDAAVAAAAALTVPVVPASDVERALCSVSSDGERLVGPGNGANAAYGSGGFLDFVFRYAALELYGVDVGSGPLSFERGRNADFEHVTLQVDGVTVLSFAKAYGFRNISTIVTKVKRGRCPYDFVEVMACPSGCVNGGGQVRALPADGATAATDAQARDLVVHVNRLLHDRESLTPTASPLYQLLYRDVLSDVPGGPVARQHLHTTYQAVAKLAGAMPAW